MTYIVQKPAISFTGIERPLITIEFAPNIHKEETEYTYEHPQFTFGDRVTIINTYPELEFTVCALELIESKTPSGKLLNQPHWKYKVTNGQVSYWKNETALIRYQDKSSPSTCSTCPHFNNYNEPNGRGWCIQFDQPARTHHIKTDDCVVSAEKIEAFPTERDSELDIPHAEYQVGSIVKIIDADEDYTEWAVFKVVEQKYNLEVYQNPESYLTQSEWLYRVANTDGKNTFTPIWVAENEICHFDLAHNVCTSEVF